ncbi:MAG: DNA repair protein RecN [Gammaproteobacteria bacterium]|nr:DNA repair protein RecN [Gammaproteobacteria bacterium]
MLQELQIRDFAIVDRLQLQLNNGMTVFTGETGAGKSIAIDALGIALGDRADTTVVRQGSKRAEITARFNIQSNASAKQWLIEHELDDDGECILRRTINSEGGSKAYINGRPAPLQLIKELAELLIDIHSQHQHQSLLRPNDQRQLLDNFGQHQDLLSQVSLAWQQWQKTRTRYEEIRSAENERQSRVDYLKFQLNELEELAPQAGEWENLEQEHSAMSNHERIESAITESLNLLYEDNQSIASQLNQAVNLLEEVAQFNSGIQSSVELLNSAVVQIKEATSDLRSISDDSGWDAQRFQWLEDRIGDYMRLARKHHCSPETLYSFVAELQNELDSLQDADSTLLKLNKEIEFLSAEYQSLAASLSEVRQKSAARLSKEVSSYLGRLGMSGAKLSIELNTINGKGGSRHGNEEVSFCVATNKGQKPQAIQKIASGGELSRISLAIQVVTAKVARIPSMVFDEVDVGIGGGTAEVVGQLLRQLGNKRQVICITHQPQVAAQGHHHYLVKKSSGKSETFTQFQALTDEQRQHEVARMLGGVQITETSLSHAREMLDTAGALSIEEL